VLRWLAGEQPKAPVPALIAEVISGLTGRVITPADLGMVAGEIRPGLGAELPVSWPDGVRAITGLWRADVERREFVTGAAFGVAAYASAGIRWLTLPGPDLAVARAGRRIGREEIDGLREISRTYRQLGNRLGGGQLRATMVQLLDRQVTSLPNFRSQLRRRHRPGAGRRRGRASPAGSPGLARYIQPSEDHRASEVRRVAAGRHHAVVRHRHCQRRRGR
jgi:hypothetical protein